MLGLKQLLIVGVGGAVGSMVRYKLGGLILHRTESWNFPLSTFLVNVVGCLAIGVLAAMAEHHDLFGPSTRLFLFTGLLGGFTTFSAFGYEGIFLLRRGLIDAASAYICLSVICGLVAVFVGLKTVDLLWPSQH